MIRAIVREFRFLFSQRIEPLVLGVLTILAAVGVGVGVMSVQDEMARINSIRALQRTDLEAVASHVSNAGAAAYYTFHLTTKPPAPMAFVAPGQYDGAPSVFRVRALAVEGQIYESERMNPELAVQGRFDFAFVLVYIAPLLLIALLHDVRSREYEAGRLIVLNSSPDPRWRVWFPRIFVRAGLTAAALGSPLVVAGLLSNAEIFDIVYAVGLVLAMVVFWTLVCSFVARERISSASNAATLGAIWFVVTLLAPAAANLMVNASFPIPSGPGIARENREAVNDGWDLPREETLARFYTHYPEWTDTSSLTTPFHWKWYYAFQHLGDVHVADTSRGYREGVRARERLAGFVSIFLPPVAIMRSLRSLAQTDLEAELIYQDRIRAFHTQLREFYYPYIFREQSFERSDFDKSPKY